MGNAKGFSAKAALIAAAAMASLSDVTGLSAPPTEQTVQKQNRERDLVKKGIPFVNTRGGFLRGMFKAPTSLKARWEICSPNTRHAGKKKRDHARRKVKRM